MTTGRRFTYSRRTQLFGALTLGVLTGILGLVCSTVSFVQRLETDVGLEALFHARGPRVPPGEVVIISMDSVSSQRLGLTDTPGIWPRSLHTRLVKRLDRQDARVIAFDIVFSESRETPKDRAMAAAMREAGNVVLLEHLMNRPVIKPNGQVLARDFGSIVQRIPPTPLFANAAAAVAPFPLPQVPNKVSQIWLFKIGTPTLPMAALQQYARPYYSQLQALANETLPTLDLGKQLPALPTADAETILHARSLRATLSAHPELVAALEQRLDTRRSSWNPEARELLASTVASYAGEDSRFIDFYGPPHTIVTVPYHRALSQAKPRSLGGRAIDFNGKAVFVGFSEQYASDQSDNFYTVFSRADGLDISGVEIAATAFANLLEGRSVRPPPGAGWGLAVLLWGMLVGLLLSRLTGKLTILGAGLLVVAGFAGAYYMFVRHGIWLPLVVPLAIQLPVAVVGALLWQYLESHWKSQRLRHTLGLYLPTDAMAQLDQPATDATRLGSTKFGVCLATDIAGYSELAERLPPNELRALINRYFQRLFEPVRRYGGEVCDIKGDAMLAVWTQGRPEELRAAACRAALEICHAVNGPGPNLKSARLPTRIGLHCGELELGTVGYEYHFEYRPVGDIVNTAARVENLSKHLGTWLLASNDVVEGIEGIATRELGCFKPAGKNTLLVVHEVLDSRHGWASVTSHNSAAFNQALDEMRSGKWRAAHEAFAKYLSVHEKDGPAEFYLRICSRFKHRPPANWDGIVTLNEK